jgi:hypothetical protein
MKMEPVKKDYLACNDCLSTEGVYSIILGEQHTTTHRLCTKCLKELREKIENSIELE